MTEVYRFSETQILFFALILVRMSAFVVSWPVFGVETVSSHVKVLFALALALVVFPTLQWTPAQTEALNGNLILLVAREAFIGVTVGYLARTFFFAFRISGELISQAMGLSAASVFNPTLGGQSTAIEQFYLSLVSLFYLAVNGHHHLIKGLVQTFSLVPAGVMSLNVSQFSGLAQIIQEVVELGLRMSAPVVISLLVVNIVLGVVGRTVPQLNVLVTSFPINILAGLFLMIITLPMLMEHMDEYLLMSTTRVFEFVKAY